MKITSKIIKKKKIKWLYKKKNKHYKKKRPLKKYNHQKEHLRLLKKDEKFFNKWLQQK